MTIKQQGGIFGRNPTFNDVTVDGTLTTSGNLTMSGDLTTADIEVTKATGTATPDPAQVTIKTESSGSNWSTSEPWGRLAFYNSDGSGGGPKIHATMDAIARASAGSYSKVSFKTSDASSDTLTEVLRFEPSSKDVVVSNGNLVIETSGQGIDFSATSGTGTSELFDDYEEGTWTPIYIPQTGSFATMTMSVSEAKYTKIGRFVYIQASILTNNVDTTGASGGLRLSGFPFSSSGFGSFIVSYAQNWGGDVPLYGYIENGTTYANLRYRTSVNGADSSMLVGDLTAGAVASQNYMIVSGVYTVA